MFKITGFSADGVFGWLDRPDAVVEMFEGDHCVAQTRSALSADKDAFAFKFDNLFWPIVGAHDISFRAQGHPRGPEVADGVVGYLPRTVNLSLELKNYCENIANYPEVPQELITYIGSGTAGQVGYRKIGAGLFFHILEKTGVRPSPRILDIGAGAGRIGFALAPHLAKGFYLGLDTWEAGVNWANANLAPIYPGRLKFRALPSPPQGRRGGYLAEYAAPLNVEAASFDLVVCTSLFTHLKRVAYASYFKQIARALKKDGVAFLTAFLIYPAEADGIRSSRPIAQEDSEGLYIIHETYADSFLYADDFFAAAAESGLVVCRYIPGVWNTGERRPRRVLGNNVQDIVIFRKA